jgi:LmbE family N-acetylglucosaminyl deacetylase
MVIQSPERNYERIFASHPDHLAAGETAIQAVYPDARNPYAFTDLKEAGFEPWRVKEVWITSSPTPNHFVDITDTFPKKIAALKAHVSQTAHNAELEEMVRSWGERNAIAQGLPEGRVAEIFKVIDTN